MHPYLELDLEQDSPEWHAWRAGGFGGSDMPALIGDNKYKPRETLLTEKANGNSGGGEANAAMLEGKRLEEPARQAYCTYTGIHVTPLCIQHRDYDWARVSLDGIAEDRQTVVEIKCGKSAYRIALQDEIPKYYYGQLQHILFITGLDELDYWCYRPDESGILMPVTRSDAYIERIIETGEQFKGHLPGYT